MRDYQIKIEPFEFIALQNLQIRKEINQHAQAIVNLQIREELKSTYLKKLLEDTWIQIKAVGEAGENRVLFQGIVMGFSFDRLEHETCMRLEVTSGTILMDLLEHFRTFQNPAMKQLAIHRMLVISYTDAGCTCMEAENAETGSVLIQYKETDWQFLKRLSGREGRVLVPDSEAKGIKYFIGLPGGRDWNIEEENIQFITDIKEYKEKSENGIKGLSQADAMALVIESREIYGIGDKTKFNGREYIIYKIESSYIGAECLHTYYFKTKKGLRILPAMNDSVSGCSFDALVTGVSRDKVRINIRRDENGQSQDRSWFPYSTVYSAPDGTGWYCMPEEGDSVMLYIPEREEDSFVISSVHMEASSSRQNPDYKSFKTKHGKEILFTPDTLILTNNKGMIVEINDKSGIFIGSDKNIVIGAQDSLTISSSKASLLIAAEDKVQVSQQGTTMTLSNDISFTGGEFRIQ